MVVAVLSFLRCAVPSAATYEWWSLGEPLLVVWHCVPLSQILTQNSEPIAYRCHELLSGYGLALPDTEAGSAGISGTQKSLADALADKPATIC